MIATAPDPRSKRTQGIQPKIELRLEPEIELRAELKMELKAELLKAELLKTELRMERPRSVPQL
jgi:hypothetical protein